MRHVSVNYCSQKLRYLKYAALTKIRAEIANNTCLWLATERHLVGSVDSSMRRSGTEPAVAIVLEVDEGIWQISRANPACMVLDTEVDIYVEHRYKASNQDELLDTIVDG